MHLQFERLEPLTDHIPYSLLLLADETIEAIDKYIFSSQVYLVKDEQHHTVGVFCLQELDSETIELKNIAVAEAFQSKGLGSKIIDYIKHICAPQYATLLVGTADCGFRQIAFYERNGFNKYAVRKDFFVENYPEPIMENGKQLRDMVVLKYDLLKK